MTALFSYMHTYPLDTMCFAAFFVRWDCNMLNYYNPLTRQTRPEARRQVPVTIGSLDEKRAQESPVLSLGRVCS